MKLNKCLIIFCFLTFSFWPSVNARPMITDLSERDIKINAKFSGKDILLYGARVEAGDIVVVIRGPARDYLVRKKEDIHGMWINTESVQFKNIPELYQVASSADLKDLGNDQLLQKLGIGFETIDFSAKDKDSGKFAAALKERMASDKLFDFNVINLPFLEGTLFRLHIIFPAKIHDGVYTAEIYSFNDGVLSGMQSIPIKAERAGLEAFIYDMAHQHKIFYGIGAVIIASLTGVVAGRYFRKV